jgi:prevent-host-death family protein
METVGVRELKERASELLRRVREDGEVVEITYRGQVVAKMIPTRYDVDQARLAVIWQEMDELAEEVGRDWPDGVSAVDAVREVRREL